MERYKNALKGMCVGIMGIELIINSENDWNYKVFALFDWRCGVNGLIKILKFDLDCFLFCGIHWVTFWMDCQIIIFKM